MNTQGRNVSKGSVHACCFVVQDEPFLPFEFLHNSSVPVKSWQDPVSIDIQWSQPIECQSWQDPARIWQGIMNYAKTRLFALIVSVYLIIGKMASVNAHYRVLCDSFASYHDLVFRIDTSSISKRVASKNFCCQSAMHISDEYLVRNFRLSLLCFSKEYQS